MHTTDRKAFLLNWPPSRGKKPYYLCAKPIYTIPEPGVEDFDFKPSGEQALERGEILRALTNPQSAIEYITLRGPASRLPKEPFETSFVLSHPVKAISEFSFEESVSGIIKGWGKTTHLMTDLMKPETITIKITYPLTKGVKITIRPYRCGPKGSVPYMKLGYVLWCVAREYRRIYKEWRRYGVWGHSIEDLMFVSFEIDDSGRADLEVIS